MTGNVEERFLALFRSNSESFVVRRSIGKPRAKDGKLEAEYVTLRRRVSYTDVADHLSGKTCLVLKPDLSNGTCSWAMLDHDHYNEKTCAILRDEICSGGFALYPFPSKSGGLHSAIFFRVPQPIAAVRSLLADLAAQLGDSQCEIFPKPVVSSGALPFGIAVPFFGEREEFEHFEPNFSEPLPNCDVRRGIESVEAHDFATYGVKLPSGTDFGAILKEKLKFNIRHETDGVSYDYHGIGGQACLIQGTMHRGHELNARQARFLVKDGYVCHQCFDSDCQGVDEPKTRRTLQKLEILEALRTESFVAAEVAITALEADKKRNPTPVIEAVAKVNDAPQRELLICRLAAIRISGVTRKLIEQQVKRLRAEAEAEGKEVVARRQHARLLQLGATMCGEELLDRVCLFIRRFVLLSEEQAQLGVLWVAHTHAFDAAEHTPYLSINSAEKRSGKSRLLELFEALVAKPWLTGRVSAAVLPRKIQLEQPTLLLDESDAAFNGNEEYGEALRGILNTGHRQGGTTTVCVKMDGDFVPYDFSTFCPKAIAGIGKLPDTIADRSIPILMKRKKRSEKVTRFRRRDKNVQAEAAQLREQLAAYCTVNLEKLRDARPELPDALSDRQQDGAEPLLAIADAVGGKWPEKARHAFVVLCAEAQAVDDSIGVRLLSDIRSVFALRRVERLPSAELASALAEFEESPWGEWNKGKPISQAKVAQLLRRYEITPHNIRMSQDGRVPKGYQLDDFADVWGRYLPPDVSPHIPQTLNAPVLKRYTVTTLTNASENADFEDAKSSHSSVSENVQVACENAPCSGVAVSRALIEQKVEEEL